MNIETVFQLHQYYEETPSLVKTCNYAWEEFGIEVTRHQLSRLFRANGLHVNPPNGRADLYYQDFSSYRSPESEFAADLLRAAIKDVIAGPSVDYVGWLTGCIFFDTELYKLALGTLLNASDLTLSGVLFTEKLGGGEIFDGIIDPETVQLGQIIYDKGYKNWVADISD